MSTRPPHIAVVEDEQSLRQDLCDYLALRGFAVSGYASAEALYAAVPEQAFDLVLLDIGLPGDNGLQAAQWLRLNRRVGIVMLTAFKDPANQISGLNAGADAYLVKNTPMEIIEATCRSVLRRIHSDEMPATAGLWLLHSTAWQLTLPDGRSIALTHTETLFLQCLLQRPGIPVSRDELLRAIGKDDTVSNRRNLENCASRLRRKVLQAHGWDIPIRTGYSLGYTFAGVARVV